MTGAQTLTSNEPQEENPTMTQSQMIPPTDTVTAEAVAAAQATIAQPNREAAEAHKLRLQRDAAAKVAEKAAFASNRQRLELAIESAVRDNNPQALAKVLKEAKPIGLGAGYLRECVRYRPAFLRGAGITEFHDANRVEPTGTAQWRGREVPHPR